MDIIKYPIRKLLHDLGIFLLAWNSHSFLSPCRSEEANKAFSAAVQMHDVLVKAWAMWGDYLENIFVKERQLHLGVSAITCYLHACRHQNESKSRKYLAKVRFWCLNIHMPKLLWLEKYQVPIKSFTWGWNCMHGCCIVIAWKSS